MSPEKQRRLSYDIMHKKLQKVVARMVEEEDELSIRRVAEIAKILPQQPISTDVWT